MVRSLTLFLSACALTAGTAAAQDDPGKKLLKKLEGTYSVVAMEFGGEKAPEAYLQRAKYAIRGDQLIANAGMGKKEDPITIKLDPTKKPGHIDFEEKERDTGKTRTFHGIFKYENGQLTICASQSDKPADRPKEFKTDKTKHFLLVLKRDGSPKK